MNFYKVACPFLSVKYLGLNNSIPICLKNGFGKDGCSGCAMLEETPTQRLYEYNKMFGGKDD